MGSVAIATTTNLKEQLADLSKVEGIVAAVIVSRDGFVIEGVNQSPDMDLDGVGAVISAGMGATEVMGGELRVGNFAQSMIEFEKGIVVVSSVGEAGTLAVVADLKSNLGNVRYQIKRRLPGIQAAL
jgi:predicted regulator of Ras-like GTPase activity (Roadblock/LC7/MglB family)